MVLLLLFHCSRQCGLQKKKFKKKRAKLKFNISSNHRSNTRLLYTSFTQKFQRQTYKQKKKLFSNVFFIFIYNKVT